MGLPTPKNYAYETFAGNLASARNMVKAGRSLDSQGVGSVDTSDLYRGAWVQAVSALDYFMHQEIKRRVAAIAYGPAGERPQALAALKVTLGQAEDLRSGTMSPAELVLEAVGHEIGRQTIQKPEAISRYLRYVTNRDVWNGVAQFVRESSQSHAGLNAQELKDKLNSIVQRRNVIAHRADIPDSSSGVKSSLEADAADTAIELIELIALGIHQSLGEVIDIAETATASAKAKKNPPSTWLINEYGALEEGTELELVQTKPIRNGLGVWLDEDPARTRATWTGVYPYLRWAADGNEYSPSGLITKMYALTEQNYVAVQGPMVWAVPGRGTLAQIADRLYQDQANSRR